MSGLLSVSCDLARNTIRQSLQGDSAIIERKPEKLFYPFDDDEICKEREREREKESESERKRNRKRERDALECAIKPLFLV